MKPDWNIILKVAIVAAIIAAMATSVLSAQSSSQTRLLEQGLKAIEAGEPLKAFEIWEQAEEPGYTVARHYLQLAAKESMKGRYEKATQQYYWSLNGPFTHPAERQAFENDLLYLELLMTPEEFEERFGSKNEKELPQAVRLFWKSADPLPTTPSNLRLIEHYRRVPQAIEQFPDENSPLEFDDRGKACGCDLVSPIKCKILIYRLKTVEKSMSFISDFFCS